MYPKVDSMLRRQEPNWRLMAATDADVRRWSYGSVEKIEDLYSPPIFGATEDLRCQCGDLTGEQYIGRICPNCKVTIEADAARARKRRLGKLSLACHYAHPLTEEWINVFPILPVAYRLTANGEPTALGKKYETLVNVNTDLLSKLPARGMDAYYDSGLLKGRPELTSVLHDIIGTGPLLVEGSTLLSLLLHAVVGVDDEIAPIARACGLTLEVTANV